MRKITPVLIALVITIVTPSILWNRINPKPENQAHKTTINYGINGFFPNTAKIKTGTTITFQNLGKTALLITSKNYPEFKSGVVINKNNSWSFTFIEKGFWSYQNDLEPSHQASITVE